MKSLNQMDLDDWELLPDDGFLEIHDDGGNKIYSRKHHPNSVFHMNYFIAPPKSTPQFADTTKLPNHLVPLPIDLQPTVVHSQQQDDDALKKESNKIPVEIKIMPPSPSEHIKSFEVAADQDPVSQVFFKKMKEAEFVDMKVESPKSSSTSRGIMTQIEGAGAFLFEENGDHCKDDSEMEINKNNVELDLRENDEGGLNIWKWSLSGIGAICSFGVAAATVCIIVFSSHQKNRQNQKLQFQIYSNDKRMKEVVRHANRLNEAISAARGVAVTRARITVGGYYDASL